jgi:hypothetical protein
MVLSALATNFQLGLLLRKVDDFMKVVRRR